MSYKSFYARRGGWGRFVGPTAARMATQAIFLSLMVSLLSLPMPRSTYAEGAYMTHGPVVGGVEPQNAKIFVRADQQAEVRIAYSLSPDLDGSVMSLPRTARKKKDYTVQVRLSNLHPNRTYYYDVLVDGASQTSPPYPSFTTFPRRSKIVPFRFAVMADGGTASILPTYESVASEGPHFVLQLGDFPHGNKDTLGGARRQYKQVYGGESFATFIGPKFPFFHTWDDHDYGINNSDKTWFNKENSLKAFKEYFPTPKLANPDHGIWHSFRYAQAEFFVLDCRSQRDVASDHDDATKSMLDGDNIAAGQKEWLKNGLGASTAKWKFILSSVPLNPTAKPSDCWGAYTTERQELLNFIAGNGIKNVIVLSGDLHAGGRLDDGTHSGDPALGVWIPEMNVPQQASEYRDEIGCTGDICGEWSEAELTQSGGYGLVTVETEPVRVLLEIKDWEGRLRQFLIVDDEEP